MPSRLGHGIHRLVGAELADHQARIAAIKDELAGRRGVGLSDGEGRVPG